MLLYHIMHSLANSAFFSNVAIYEYFNRGLDFQTIYGSLRKEERRKGEN